MAQRGEAVGNGWMGKRLLLAGRVTAVRPDGYLPRAECQTSFQGCQDGGYLGKELGSHLPKGGG